MTGVHSPLSPFASVLQVSAGKQSLSEQQSYGQPQTPLRQTSTVTPLRVTTVHSPMPPRHDWQSMLISHGPPGLDMHSFNGAVGTTWVQSL
jgi:hypothetical protein